MKPKISTSFRPHGKWGDFLAAIVPILWCLNILTNSNFILRLIEWQYENNLFTIRIRARQWYWVYKIDLKNFLNISNINKNIGSNKWISNSKNSNSFNLNKNLSILTNKTFNNNLNIFWKEYSQKTSNIKKLNYFFNIENTSFQKFNNNNNNISNYKSYWSFLKNKNIKTVGIIENSFLSISNGINFNFKKKNYINNIDNFNSIFDSLDNSRYLKRNYGQFLPFRLINYNLNFNNNRLFLFKINSNNNFFENRDVFNSNYYVIKQKKYTKKNNSLNFNKNGSIKNIFLFNNRIFLEEKNNIFINYKLIKKNKNHHDMIPLTLNKRLLRTKKTLIIPAHINISLITSSFDIVHSWFVPGLGLKLDCVPGRSTHHTFYIDNVGFYYGQCAEICGRYHHHMPIRLCALPFEHFLIWWQNFGLLKILNLKNKKNNIIFSFRKFCW